MNFYNWLSEISFLKRQLLVLEKSFLDMSRNLLIFGGLKRCKLVHIIPYLCIEVLFAQFGRFNPRILWTLNTQLVFTFRNIRLDYFWLNKDIIWRLRGHLGRVFFERFLHCHLWGCRFLQIGVERRLYYCHWCCLGLWWSVFQDQLSLGGKGRLRNNPLVIWGLSTFYSRNILWLRFL